MLLATSCNAMSFAQIVMAATKSIKIYYDIFVNLRKGALMRCEIMDLLSVREIEIIYAIKYLDGMFYGFRFVSLLFLKFLPQKVCLIWTGF